VVFLGNLAATLEGAKRLVEQGIARSEIFKKWIYIFVIITTAAGPVGYYVVNLLAMTKLLLS
jgi:hypothetical protein